MREGEPSPDETLVDAWSVLHDLEASKRALDVAFRHIDEGVARLQSSGLSSGDADLDGEIRQRILIGLFKAASNGKINAETLCDVGRVRSYLGRCIKNEITRVAKSNKRKPTQPLGEDPEALFERLDTGRSGILTRDDEQAAADIAATVTTVAAYLLDTCGRKDRRETIERTMAEFHALVLEEGVSREALVTRELERATNTDGSDALKRARQRLNSRHSRIRLLVIELLDACEAAFPDRPASDAPLLTVEALYSLRSFLEATRVRSPPHPKARK